jgi:hypothetical protein
VATAMCNNVFITEINYNYVQTFLKFKIEKELKIHDKSFAMQFRIEKIKSRKYFIKVI